MGQPRPPDSVGQTMQAQAVLDHPRVMPYLHLEVAGNVPLTVALPADLSQGAAGLRAGGQPVRAVTEGARVRFLSRESLDGPTVRLSFEIAAEGVTGHVDLNLVDHVWTAMAAEVTEQ